MSKELTFNQTKGTHFKILSQYVPIVDRVHGGSHPEFHEVRSIFELIDNLTKKAGDNIPNLDGEFKRLRVITNNYKVPNDVCESYEAVYNMLEEVDKAYHSKER